HAHEDHIGALPYILRDLPAPVWGTRYTTAHFRMKLGEHPDLDPDIRLIEDNVSFSLGQLEILPLPVTHSIVGAVALAIQTPVGRVLHTGDFRLDSNPLDGRHTNVEGFKELGDNGVVLMLSDSTNSERSGRTASEADVRDALTDVIAQAEHRVMVTTFSSNLLRLQAVLDASHAAGRTVLPVGRSMSQTIQLALENGFLKVPRGTIADISNFESFTRQQVTLLVSGSQGEPRGSFSRIAHGTHGLAYLEPGDTVIMSSRRIPGNEVRIGQAINGLYRLGVNIIDDRQATVHTSGHAYREEQQEMIRWVRPEWFVPIHGEYRHMVHHARNAHQAGVKREKILITEDGHPLALSRNAQGVQLTRKAEVDAGPVYAAGGAVGLIDDVVLRDRQILQSSGIVFCVVVLDDDDQIVSGPQIGTRGTVHVDENPGWIEDAIDAVLRALERVTDPPDDLEGWGQVVKQALKRHLRREHDIRPLLVPMVLRTE
ncbi:MAG: ribonuclease J, partial [Myxococcota bacterium]